MFYLTTVFSLSTFSVTGCITADEVGERLFLSDTNHHRIIMFEKNGKILDSVSELNHIWGILIFIEFLCSVPLEGHS